MNEFEIFRPGREHNAEAGSRISHGTEIAECHYANTS